MLVHAFWEICLLRRGPQDVPRSRFLFNLVLVGYFFCGLTLHLFGFSAAPAIVLSLTSTILTLIYLKAVLRLRGLGERYTQTATALLGSSIVLFVPALAIRYWFHLIQLAGTQSNTAAYLWVGLFVWQLFVSAHILRHALSTRLFIGFVFTIVYVFVEFQVLSAVRFLFDQ